MAQIVSYSGRVAVPKKEPEPKEASLLEVATTVGPMAYKTLDFINKRSDKLLTDSGYLDKSMTIPTIGNEEEKIFKIFEKKPGKGIFRSPEDRLRFTEEASEYFQGQDKPIQSFMDYMGKDAGFLDTKKIAQSANWFDPKRGLKTDMFQPPSSIGRPAGSMPFNPLSPQQGGAMPFNPLAPRPTPMMPGKTGIGFNPFQPKGTGIGFSPSNIGTVPNLLPPGGQVAGQIAGQTAGQAGGGFFSNLMGGQAGGGGLSNILGMAGPGGWMAKMALGMLGKKLFKPHTALGKIFRLFG